MIEPTVFTSAAPVETPSNYPNSEFMGGSDDEDKTTEDFRKKVLQAAIWNYQKWDEARKPHLALSQQVWDRYNNLWDFQKKADWQSQRPIPKVTTTVERLVASLGRLLTMSKKWFRTRSRGSKRAKYINFVQSVMEYMLEHPRVKFRRKLKQALKVGFISFHMPVLVGWEFEGVSNPEHEAAAPSKLQFSTPLTSASEMPEDESDFLRFEVLNPHRVLVDPTNRHRGVIVERIYTKAEFKIEAEERGWLNIEEVMADNYSAAEQEAEEAHMREIPSTSLSTDMVRIREFWMDHLSDESGAQVIPMRNFMFVMANNTHIVQPPTENPFWHKMCPVITASLIDSLFSPFGKSPILLTIDCLELWVDMINMIIDHYQQAIIGVKEVNMNLLHPDENPRGLLKLFPGKVFKKSGEGPLFTHSQPGEAPQSLPTFLQLLSGEIGEGTAMNSVQTPPKIRGKMPADDYTSRMAEAGVILDNMFENIEDDMIRPILHMAYKDILQFTSPESWKRLVEERVEQFPDIAKDLAALADMPPEQRFKELGPDIEFECKVFSAIFGRQEEVEKGTFFLGMIGRIPMGAAHVKWGNMLKAVVENLGWDPDEMISDTPLIPYSEAMGGKAPRGSDGGEAIPQQPPGPGQMQNQAAGASGGMGQQDASLNKMAGGNPA